MRSPVITVCAAGPAKTGVSSLLAENLAVLLARRGGKALLLDAARQRGCVDWGVARARARLRPRVDVSQVQDESLAARLEHERVDHLVIDAGSAETRPGRSAFMVARVAVVAVPVEHAGGSCPAPLAAVLSDARMFNPGLRILCLPVGGEADPDEVATCRVQVFAARIGLAEVPDTVLHLPALRWGAGLAGQCACDLRDSAGADEMARLLAQISPMPSRPPRLFFKWRPFTA